MVAKFPVLVNFEIYQTQSLDMPWFDQMSNSEDDTKNNTDTTNDNIGNSEEGVLSAHDSPSRDENGLGASIDGNGEVWNSQQRQQQR